MTESTIMSAEILRAITKTIFEENSNKSDYALASDVGVQGHFATSYKTRYLLELLQNARDAIVDGAVNKGKVKAWILDGIFYFANNGKGFNEKGVNSICYPAISDKNSRDFIGHKGIGFNAVLEITEAPEIITEYGTFYFNAIEAGKLIQKDPEKLALFRYPLFKDRTVIDINPDLHADGYTTVFKFPLKAEFMEQKDLLSSDKLSVTDLIFLSAIHNLIIEDNRLEIDTKTIPIRAIQNDLPSRYFKSYDTNFEFDQETINTFDKHEQEQFKDSNLVECRFLLELDSNSAFVPSTSPRLHLFYALDFDTGFNFSIHSYFSVSIERKNLASSLLNKFLFKEIASYYVGEFFNQLKLDFTHNELPVLAYNRLPNNNMNVLYDELAKLWRDTAFIYHAPSKAYLKPAQVYLVTTEEYEVFVDGMLGSMALLNPKDQIREWLKKECGVQGLPDSYIINHIESKCNQYQQIPIFFERLYKLIARRKLKVPHKKILLTQNLSLVSGNDVDVYYQRNTHFVSPAALDAELSFIHELITIFNIREDGKELLGVKEYNEANVIDIAIKILGNLQGETAESLEVIRELIHFLYQFKIKDAVKLYKIFEAVRLPVYHLKTSEKSWAKPLFTPIYFDDFPLQDLYEKDIYYLDAESLGVNSNTEEWKSFLGDIGVWDIPAVYVLHEIQATGIGEKVFHVINSRALHLPKVISTLFFETISGNWNIIYKALIIDDRFSCKMSLQGKNHLNTSEKLLYSKFRNDLLNLEWIPAKQNSETLLYKPSAVLGLNPEDNRKSSNQLISNFVPVYVAELNSHRSFIDDFGIMHCNNTGIDNFHLILNHVEKTFSDLTLIKDGKNFEHFYNRILSFVYEYLYATKNESFLQQLKEKKFLTRNVQTKDLAWTLGKNCIHVDEKSFLDRLLQHKVFGEIPNPFSFTKRDKNEWGRFAGRIGRPISKIVIPLVTSIGKPAPLTKQFNSFEFILAFVENDLEHNFTDDQILFFKGAIFNIHNNLTISYAVDGKAISVNEHYYVSGEKEKTVLELNNPSFQSVRLLSQALLNYFEHFTGKELKRLDLVFEYLLNPGGNPKARLKYSLNHDVDQFRIDFISALLQQEYYVEPEKSPSIPITPKKTGAKKPEYAEKVTIVTEEKEIKEIISDDSFQDFLNHLDQFVNAPSYSLIHQPLESAMAPTQNDNARIAFPYSRKMQIELSDQWRKNIGFLAEYYIYKKIMEGETTFLDCLGLDKLQAKSITWLNEHRISDPSAVDGSVGKGHDFYCRDHDIAIEVKGMINQSSYFSITEPEILSMKSRGKSYFLVIVKHILSEDIQTVVIQDPYDKIISGELHFIEAKIYSPKHA